MIYYYYNDEHKIINWAVNLCGKLLACLSFSGKIFWFISVSYISFKLLAINETSAVYLLKKKFIMSKLLNNYIQANDMIIIFK